jgi:hypothetical protein
VGPTVWCQARETEDTNKGQDNGKAITLVGVCLTDQLGADLWALQVHFIVELALRGQDVEERR